MPSIKQRTLTLIKSISGIRGTIGGQPARNLTPIDIVECTAGFGQWLIHQGVNKKVVVGRDGRISGQMVSQLAIQTLVAMGFDVVDLGLSTTPTVEIAVPKEEAGAGIIFTASHNPKQWNALKFLNHKGEFISAQAGKEIIELIEAKELHFADVDKLGSVVSKEGYIEEHLQEICSMDLVDVDLIKQGKFHVVVDCINSTGAISIPPLLDMLGCTYTLINGTINGEFAHNPEPLPQHLTELSEAVVTENANFGISVDPDVDRLCFVCEDGSMFGEEYTLVAVADYMLSKTPGVAVSNLSSTRALADICNRRNSRYVASAVGEVNVVNAMKEHKAIIGGEGNGGIIVPDLHYGRDALVGIALFLSHLANEKKSLLELKATYPAYTIIKDKVQLDESTDVDGILQNVHQAFIHEKVTTIDGVKIDFENGWVHIRKSNTEPIIRVYCEAKNQQEAQELIQQVKNKM